MFQQPLQVSAWLPGWLEALISGNAANATVEFVILLIVLAAMLVLRNASGAFPARIENALRIWSRSERRALVLAFLLPIVARIALLALYPPPQPAIHDEFSYLLIADTLLEGRLTNPPHPLWQHLETIHVFFDPTYSSKYPIGNGLLLAIPQFFGLPSYTGIWLTCGLMSAAIYWMLRPWLAAHWALFGCLILLPRESIMSTWMHSYWGGAMAALGGALLLGGGVRILQQTRPKDAWLMGLGVFLLAITRPYEGAALSLVMGVALAVWLLKSQLPSNRKLRDVIVPLAACGVATISFLMVHNQAVTGDPFKLPYVRNRELYGTPQTFYWQDPAPPAVFRHRVIRDNYDWQLEMHSKGETLSGLLEQIQWKLKEFWLFFIGPALTIPLLFLFRGGRLPRSGLPLAALLAVLIAVNCYPFFYYHYFAPITGVLLLFALWGFQRIRSWPHPIGIPLSRALVVVGLLSYMWQIGLDAFHSRNRNLNTPRTQVTEALHKMGGQHVVLVRYAPDHSFHHEIVYNGADIDSSPIVWARDMGPLRNQNLAQYYQGRKLWLFEPDFKPPRLTPYEPLPIPGIPNFPGFR